MDVIKDARFAPTWQAARRVHAADTAQTMVPELEKGPRDTPSPQFRVLRTAGAEERASREYAFPLHIEHPKVLHYNTLYTHH